MIFKVRDIERALPSNGFERAVRGHIYFMFQYKGKDCGVSTHVSHGSKEVGDSLIGQMAKQLRLSKANFVDLVECPMGHDEYVAELKRQALLPS